MPRFDPVTRNRKETIMTPTTRDLIDALRWALDQIDHSLDPDHQAALDAAWTLVAEFDHQDYLDQMSALDDVMVNRNPVTL